MNPRVKESKMNLHLFATDGGGEGGDGLPGEPWPTPPEPPSPDGGPRFAL